MSLERFSNINEIDAKPGLTRGIEWSTAQVGEFQLTELSTRPSKTTIVEVHVYTPTNRKYLGGGPTPHFRIQGSKLYIDYISVFNDLNIKRGFFKVSVTAYYEIVGTYDYPEITIQEVSADRREFLLKEFIARASEQTTGKLANFLRTYQDPFDADIYLNLGQNNFLRLINWKSYLSNTNILAVRSLKALDPDVPVLARVSLIESITDTWIDNISLDQLEAQAPPATLRGPNFDVDSGYTTISETDFKNWNSLLGSNLTTSQKIVDSYFSGSMSGAELGLDYTAFPNWAYYSSAALRVEHFKNKLQDIEYYNDRLNVLNNTSGSSSGSLSVNIENTRKRLNNVIGSFDQFERWLYNEPTASLFTHAITGSSFGSEGDFFAISPYPKRLVNGIQTLYHTTASVSETWYDTLYTNAVIYDTNNPHQLTKTIPEWIREDSDNSEYDKFVNMIGHHFDILYTYATALTRVSEKQEHPKLGMDNDILVDIAKSQGWRLVNGQQASQLWQYKLGTNESGEVASTGSLYSVSNEQITGEVWRRIVNNLPYILKSRGTERGIKALLNIYGIPQTLLSIREYGGPKVGNEWPVLTEDRYSYGVLFNTGSYITYPSVHVSASFDDWGRDLSTTNVVPVQTRELRFRPYATGSMILLSQINDSGDPLMHLALEHTGSYSGSRFYGRLNISFGSGSGVSPITASSNWLPIFNGEFWNVTYGWQTDGDHFNSGSNSDTTYRIRIGHASDFIKGKVSHTSSINFTPSNSDHYLIWSHPTDITKNVVYIGGNTGSSDNLNVNAYLTSLMGMPGTYSGSMQEYREFLEYVSDAAYKDHVLNPTSYVSGLSPTSSYDTLIRHYTLGSETIGVDLSTDGTIISSSHPNHAVKDFTTNNAYSTNANAYGFNTPLDLQRGNFIPVEETYYVQGVSLGATNPKSQKIRLEDNEVLRQLTPIKSSERSSFDNAPLDSHKLGLFYSFADQVNKDIFNHIGRVELDDFIGDPDNEYELTYNDLRHFSDQYWKKFTEGSDVNAFNRIFSQFDFTVFNQIKQTLPERVDEATGLLVEPNILERNKVQITKPIKVENPQYELTLYNRETSSAEYHNNYEGSITSDETKVLTPSCVFLSEHSDTLYAVRNTGSMNYCTIETLPVDELVVFTSSINESNFLATSETASIYTNYGTQKVLYNTAYALSTSPWISSGIGSALWNVSITNGASVAANRIISSSIGSGLYSTQIRLQLDTYSQYDSETTFNVKIKGTTDSAASGSYTAILATTTEIYGDSNVNNRYNRVLASNEGTLLLNDSEETISFEKILIPSDTYITLIIQFKNIDAATQLFTIKQITPLCTVNSVCHSSHQRVIDNCRLSTIYSKTIYHYSGSSTISDKRLRDADMLVSESLGLYYSRSLETACYRDDFYETHERMFYLGTQIKAAGFNLPTKDNALNGTPVIEIYEVNPNQLFYNSTPQQPGPGNTLDPGNLTVR